jgi:hypothetical protein
MLRQGESCKQCYYFNQDNSEAEQSHGDCLRFPPQTIPVGGMGNLVDTEQVQVKIIVSRTHSSFGCGEFRDKADVVSRH